ncbi:MAG: fructosamine kinase family protein [Lachnospiraceae bacterium]|nr:fructosamine kinase family protein [Lachnospiraceae bacterium]
MKTVSGAATIDEAVGITYGKGVYVTEKRRVSGGDINDAFILQLSDGQKVFLKENSKRNSDFFSAETEGLEVLSGTKAIGVPEVHSYGSYGDRAFLLMECLEAGNRVPDFWERFGHALADMHKASAAQLLEDGKFGFYQDNYIGAGYQKNTVKNTWTEFFRDCRLIPQLERARSALSTEDIKQAEYLLEHLEEYLVEPEHPSILHGDLWGGNFMVGPDGAAWLIDPAVYVGAAEADIAMTELFGGFSYAFYGSYRESGLIQPGYEDRRDIYNLYHMLNHLNLFGGSYLYAVKRIISRYS